MKNVIGVIFIFFGVITLLCTNAPLIEGIRDITIGYLFLDKEEK